MNRTLQDTLLLLNLYRREQFRSSQSRIRQALILVGLLVATLAFGFLSVGAGLLLAEFVRDLGTGIGLEEGTPLGLILTAAMLASTFFAFGQALNALFLSRDMDLLMTAPVDVRAVFIAKLLMALPFQYALIFILSGPAFVTYGIVLGYGPLYFVLGFILLLGAPLFGVGIGALLALALAWIIPAKRLFQGFTVVSALFGVALYLFSQLPSLLQERDDAAAITTDIAELLAPLNNLPLPSMWAGHGLALAGRGLLLESLAQIALYLVFTFGLFGLAALLAEGLYPRGWLKMQAAGSAKRAADLDGGPGLLANDRFIVALAIKDWYTRLREPSILSQILTSAGLTMVMMVVLALQFLGTGTEGSEMIGSLTSFGQDHPLITILSAIQNGIPGIIAGGLITFSSTILLSNTSLASVAQEGRAAHILKSAPVDAQSVYNGKLLGPVALFVVFGLVAWLGFMLVMGLSLPWVVYGFAIMLTMGVASLAAQTAIGFSNPRFHWKNAREMSSGLGSLIALALTLVLFLLLGLISVAGFALALLYPASAILAIAAAVTIDVLIAGAVYLAASAYAGRAWRRIEIN
jgi:ABC-2 type transport system permease protein